MNMHLLCLQEVTILPPKESKQLTDEELANKTEVILEEYLASADLEEASACIQVK
jgi:hypothetical protein